MNVNTGETMYGLRTAKWKRTVTLRHKIEAAAENEAKIPALLTEMAKIVAPEGAGFAEELREAAEGGETTRADADWWLNEFYDFCDTHRIWVN